MRVITRIDNQFLKRYGETAINNLVKTADAIKTDLQESQTMPFDTGEMQNRSTYIDASQKKAGRVPLISDTPYARKMYFHPEYKFQTIKNPLAGAFWFEPYLTGAKKDLAFKVFAMLMIRSTIGSVIR